MIFSAAYTPTTPPNGTSTSEPSSLKRLWSTSFSHWLSTLASLASVWSKGWLTSVPCAHATRRGLTAKPSKILKQSTLDQPSSCTTAWPSSSTSCGSPSFSDQGRPCCLQSPQQDSCSPTSVSAWEWRTPTPSHPCTIVDLPRPHWMLYRWPRSCTPCKECGCSRTSRCSRMRCQWFPTLICTRCKVTSSRSCSRKSLQEPCSCASSSLTLLRNSWSWSLRTSSALTTRTRSQRKT